MNKCRTCFYWDPIENEGVRDERRDEYILGRCRRHAPLPERRMDYDPNRPEGTAIWPVTSAEDRCGDGKDRK